jgi:peptide/nickel transport system substrate-binding protein
MDKRIHPAVEMYAREYEAGKLSRREFISRATMLGLASTTAYGLIGAAAPTPARAQPVTGGTIRINMETKALKDPRLWDWTELANFCRGWLDYLTVFNRDGSVTDRCVKAGRSAMTQRSTR